MANTNNDRKRKTKTNKSKAGISFSSKSFDILMMVLSVVILVFIISSKTGFLGKFITGNFIKFFGIVSYAIPVLLFFSFLFLYRNKFKENLKTFILMYLLAIFTMIILSSMNTNVDGGLIGDSLSKLIVGFIGIIGTWIVYLILWLTFIVCVTKYTYKDFFIKIKDIFLLIINKIKDLISFIKHKRDEKKTDKDEKESTSKTITNKVDEKNEDNSKEEKKEFDNKFLEATINQYKSSQVELGDFSKNLKKNFDNYNYPSIDLLDDVKLENSTDKKEVKDKAKEIEETLESFGIRAKVVQINIGPSVTCYELQVARGVKVSRILNLADDLSLSLATSDIRIEAPIPGKPHVGIEVPNKNKQMVGLKEMIGSKSFLESKYKLPMILGKSISGLPEVYGIEKTPHLLISGATGSGKSVCINTIIMSLLFKHSPDEVKLLMIDPKVVELSVYNGIPHLIMPVITDPKKASSSLFWAISEMERRYKLFEENQVRDIASYRESQKMDDSLEKLPFIVIIIDELADLMMTAASEVEDYITRLAQKSRACGIHLIIATQRPTVDVITGTIKANIPSRIAFAVSSQVDSRTILDMAGAERLLGKGDMLFAPTEAMKPIRIQGAFVSDAEVSRVVKKIKEKNFSDYNEEAIEKVEEKTVKIDDSDQDELLDKAIEIIINDKTASVSLLQRRLKVGYARAGRIIDQLEQRGIVGPYEGSKPRKVLIDRSYLEGENNEYSK